MHMVSWSIDKGVWLPAGDEGASSGGSMSAARCDDTRDLGVGACVVQYDWPGSGDMKRCWSIFMWCSTVAVRARSAQGIED